MASLTSQQTGYDHLVDSLENEIALELISIDIFNPAFFKSRESNATFSNLLLNMLRAILSKQRKSFPIDDAITGRGSLWQAAFM